MCKFTNSLKDEYQNGDKYHMDGLWLIEHEYYMVNISHVAFYKSRGSFPQKYILYVTEIDGHALKIWGIAAFVRFFDENFFDTEIIQKCILVISLKC